MLPRLPLVVALAAALACGAAACSDDDDAVRSDAERFCGEATANTDMIVTPPLATEAEAEQTLEFYRLMGELAPAAIATEWNELVIALETASSLVPGDPASEQEVAMTAYAIERSAYEVSVWLQRNCGVDIPITTIAPQAPVPARTTTLPPVVTTVPAG